MKYEQWDKKNLLAEVLRLKRRELSLICEQERTKEALKLAKKMILLNDLNIPHTMTVINEALK